MNKIRVLQIGKFYPPHRGGMESHLKALCDALRERVDFTVLVANDGRRTTLERVDGVRVIRAGRYGQVASVPICPALFSVAARVEADIVHVHVPNPCGVLAYLAAARHRRLVITYQSDTVRQRVLGKAFEPVMESAMRRADAVICSSPNYIESSPVLSRHRERCRVIPMGISLNGFENGQASAVERIRGEHGGRLILAVGRLVYYKGFEHLIRAMAQVRAHLVIIGEGPLRGKLEKVARDCGATDRITILGEVEEIEPYYHACDVFVLPSVARSEAFGIVQLEAMACGKPVVNTRLPSGVPYVSVHGVTGLTAPPGDAEALAGCLNLLLERSDLRARFGDAARLRVASVFSLRQMADRTYDLYSEILSKTTQASKVKSMSANA